MKSFLHVGCGHKRKDNTTRGFNTSEWHEVRLDINEDVSPDVIGTMTNMASIETGTMDALYSSHNIEHLYPHQVPIALGEFNRVLKPDGFVTITCPDLKSVARLIANDQLIEPVYHSPAGPITPLDIVYGHRDSIEGGNEYMAHKCGFTQKVLSELIKEAGFGSVASSCRAYPFFDIWLVASKNKLETPYLKELFHLYSGI